MAQTTAVPSATISTNTNTGSFVSIPQTAAAGGISLTQPPQTGGASFFKIAASQPITFGWNFTSVIAQPTHLTVSAVCDNGNTYAVGPSDGIIPGTATQVVWDVFSYQQANPATPLAQATYTLNIWDDRGPGSARLPGFLAPFSGFKFALYTPQPYTPLADGWTCQGCNAAASSLQAHPLFVAFITTFVCMLLSGWGILRRH
ncbi:hypothetical protein SCHPADRAFT_831179 [Schizopora paradoxa]|uniref:DUF7137 domain-containing protein n=1 Tax=Schizopora paradoxa TaxID=27342 RepID=A0A0H2S366_9AGAM|nr:hypothetical protein SCHPADRAFT_831179 [Schizopora paradoxa]